jgi:hypothetical protein
VAPVVAVEVFLQFVAPPAVEVDHGADVARVHQPHERRDIRNGPALAGEPASQMGVGIDRRDAGVGNGRLRQPQPGIRAVLRQR